MTDFSQFGIGEIDFVVIRLAVFGRDDKFVQAGYGFPETICLCGKLISVLNKEIRVVKNKSRMK